MLLVLERLLELLVVTDPSGRAVERACDRVALDLMTDVEETDPVA